MSVPVNVTEVPQRTTIDPGLFESFGCKYATNSPEIAKLIEETMNSVDSRTNVSLLNRMKDIIEKQIVREHYKQGVARIPTSDEAFKEITGLFLKLKGN